MHVIVRNSTFMLQSIKIIIIIILLSYKGLQQLLNIFNEIGLKLDIKFNDTKTECIVFKTVKEEKITYNTFS